MSSECKYIEIVASEACLSSKLDAATTTLLAHLLVRDDTLSELASLKQDAKSFGWQPPA